MGVSFFIPKRINVGFQERSGTYTGRLAYIIYFDEKGKLRKETSWNGWRDKKIDNQIFNNEPTSGFVLNKKVGDYVSNWNHRQAYVRVYDPRDFEFEITIQNLLYILENATSTKGKGLEGDFVYGWDGKDLVLIPCEAPDYKQLVELNALRHSEKKIGARELKIGATYRTRGNDEYVYMGKFDEYEWNGDKKKKPQFWFYSRHQEGGGSFITMGSVSQKLVEVISEEPAEDYAEIFEKLESNRYYSPIDDTRDEYVPYGADELLGRFNDRFRHWGVTVYVHTGNRIDLRRGEDDSFWYEYKNPKYNPRSYWNRHRLNDSDIDERYYLKEEFKDINDVIARLKPLRLCKYLQNGKIYSEGYGY